MTSNPFNDDFTRAITGLLREPGLCMVMQHTRVPVPGPLMRWETASLFLLSDDMQAVEAVGRTLRDYPNTARVRRDNEIAEKDLARISLNETLQRASVAVAEAFAKHAAQQGQFTRQTVLAVKRTDLAPALVCCQVQAASEESWARIVDILRLSALAFDDAAESAAELVANDSPPIDHDFSRFMAGVLRQSKGAA